MITGYSNHGDRLPVIVFTRNPAFDPEVDRAHCKPKRLALLLAMKWGIDLSQVVFVKTEGKKASKWCRESQEIVRSYLNIFNDQFRPDDWFLTDAGGAWGTKVTHVFAELGYPNHRMFPPPVHQYLSVNDNHCHGTCKTPWRLGPYYDSDDVSATLALKRRLDALPKKVILNCWENNFSMSKPSGVADSIQRTILGRGKALAESSGFYSYCADLYNRREHGRLLRSYTLSSDNVQSYDSTFDGKHWCMYNV
jgi:hypothetical protein